MEAQTTGIADLLAKSHRSKEISLIFFIATGFLGSLAIPFIIYVMASCSSPNAFSSLIHGYLILFGLCGILSIIFDVRSDVLKNSAARMLGAFNE